MERRVRMVCSRGLGLECEVMSGIDFVVGGVLR